MSSRRIASLLLVGGLVFATSPAAAQDDYLKKEAQQRFQEGVALMSESKYEPARAKFIQAYATMRVPNVVFNLARAEHLSGRYLEAARHYREYLRIADPKKLSKKDRDDVDTWLRETGKFIGRIEIAAPAGSHVSVDGERIGDAPLADPVDVEKGKHTVIAEVKGKRLSADADAPAGTVVKVALVEESAPLVPVVGAPSQPDPATHDVTPPPPKEELSWWTTTHSVGVGLSAAAVVAGVTGGVLLGAAGKKGDDGRKATEGIPSCVGVSSPQCDEAARDASSESSLRTGAGIAFVGAGLLLAGGITMMLWPTTKNTSGRATSVTVSGSSLQLTHSF